MTDYISNPQPTEVEETEMAAAGMKLYTAFLELETDQILDDYQEVYIRIAAKFAGMSYVDERTPKKVDYPFVEEVKRLIRAKKK